MSDKITLTALPLAPKEYNYEYMNRLIKQINLSLAKLEAIGPITCGSDLSSQVAAYPISGLTIINVPISPDGLPVGSVWCDTTANNVLKIVS